MSNRRAGRLPGPGTALVLAGIVLATGLVSHAPPTRAGGPSGDRLLGPTAPSTATPTRPAPRRSAAAIPALPSDSEVDRSVESEPAATLRAPRPPRAMRVIDDPLPLTRAASRQRVESLSPAPWLERWGPVVVERRRD